MVLPHYHFLSEWYQAVILTIDETFSHLSTKITTENSKNTLELRDKIFTEKLKMLHKKFVVFQIVKASGNVAFVFQRHYTQI